MCLSGEETEIEPANVKLLVLSYSRYTQEVESSTHLAGLMQWPVLYTVNEGDMVLSVPVQRVYHHVELVLCQDLIDGRDHLTRRARQLAHNAGEMQIVGSLST